MSDTKHTKGPWEACGDGKCPCRQIWSIPGDFPIFTVVNERDVRHIGVAHRMFADAPDLIYGEMSREEADANVRLIKAAPDLYEALKGLIATVEASDNDDALVKTAIAALAKAEGK